MSAQPITYTHRPTKVEAMQWNGHNELLIQKWLAPIGFHELLPEDGLVRFGSHGIKTTAEVFVKANETWVDIVVGEWIVVDKLGAYPCRDEVFRENYA